MARHATIFDEAAEQAAIQFFGQADARTISSCRGISYPEAVRELQSQREKNANEARSKSPISISARAGVLMWFIHAVDTGSLPDSQKTKPRSWWRRLFGRWMTTSAGDRKPSPPTDDVEPIVLQASDFMQAEMGQAEVSEVARRVAEGVRTIVGQGPSNATLTKTEVRTIALAQSIGLAVWDVLGNRLSQERTIAVAQAIMILELYQQRQHQPVGSPMHEWITEAIRQQPFAMQASAPVAMGFMGQAEEARDLFRDTVKIAQLSTDAAIVQALNERHS